jgi:uncharacterized membrane protein YecN with MAPEG domain
MMASSTLREYEGSQKSKVLQGEKESEWVVSSLDVGQMKYSEYVPHTVLFLKMESETVV